MKRIDIFIAVILTALLSTRCSADDYEKVQIKQGMRESAIREKFGDPLREEKLKPGFLPIPKKKALYKVDDTTYVILKYFSGRVNEVTVLDDVTSDEAASMFDQITIGNR